MLERRRPGALQLAVSMALLVLVLLVGATIVVARRADDPRRLRPAY